MITTIILAGILILFLFGVPIAFVLVLSAFLLSIYSEIPLPLLAIPQNMATGVESFTLLAVPLFILAGMLMNAAKITDRIFNFCDSIIGHIPGGLSHVNILASLIFAGMSGAAVADAAGLGEIEIKAMKEEGYDGVYSAAITGASSIIGPIFPPSIPMVVYGGLLGVSIAKLFLAGILPGLLMALVLFIGSYIISIKRKYPKKEFSGIRNYIENVTKSFWRALPALFTPIIILGSIMFGITTPTEAAALAVVYSAILGFCYKTISLKDIPNILLKAGISTAVVLFIVAGVCAFSWVITAHQIPQNFAKFIFSSIESPTLIILLMMLLLIFLGLFMNPSPALILIVPILSPILIRLGMDLVQAGVLIVLILSIGLLTPPVGIVLYIVSKIANVEVTDVIKETLPFILLLLLIAVLISFIPKITLFLPSMLVH
jgi:tripartite ATP-independent transporter DctM subunit